MKGLHVDHNLPKKKCKICIMVLNKEGWGQNSSVLVRTGFPEAFLELVEMKWEDQEKLVQDFQSIHMESDFGQILDAFPKNTDALKKMITRVYLRLNALEIKTLTTFLQDRSQWKTQMKLCGIRDTALTCEFKDKDFCQGNCPSQQFGLAALFSMCLPGLVQGLSNIIFYQVDLFSCQFNYLLITFQGRTFPVGFGREIRPTWPRQAVAKSLLKMFLIPLYLLFMVAIGPALPMFRYLIFNLNKGELQILLCGFCP